MMEKLFRAQGGGGMLSLDSAQLNFEEKHAASERTMYRVLGESFNFLK